MAKVTEVFRSLQGEGYFNVGRLSTFVRYGGCNLACSWCDSKYSIGSEAGENMSPHELFEAVHDLGDDNVVLTGGEPLFSHRKELESFIGFLFKGYGGRPGNPDIRITIETNGTRKPPLFSRKIWCFSVSPKLSSSGTRIRPDVVAEYIKALGEGKVKRLQLKFVIDNKADWVEMVNLLEGIKTEYKISDNLWVKIPIIVQPNGMCSLETYAERIKWLSELIIKVNPRYPWNYTLMLMPQTHKIAWGGEKGK